MVHNTTDASFLPVWPSLSELIDDEDVLATLSRFHKSYCGRKFNPASVMGNIQISSEAMIVNATALRATFMIKVDSTDSTSVENAQKWLQQFNKHMQTTIDSYKKTSNDFQLFYFTKVSLVIIH